MCSGYSRIELKGIGARVKPDPIPEEMRTMQKVKYIVSINGEDWFIESTKEAAYEQAVKVRATFGDKYPITIKVQVTSTIEIATI